MAVTRLSHFVVTSDTRVSDGAIEVQIPQGLAVSLWRGGVLSIAAIVFVGLAVQELYVQTLRAEIQRKRTAPVNKQLVVTRLREDNLLHRYQWVDASRKILRIPIEGARELVIADYAKDSRYVAPEGVGASAVAQKGQVPAQ